jgi:hypothetical protein
MSGSEQEPTPLRHLKRDAKALLRAAREQSPAAIARFAPYYRLTQPNGSDITPAAPPSARASLPARMVGALKLADAQSVIAHEQGHPNWMALKAALHSLPPAEEWHFVRFLPEPHLRFAVPYEAPPHHECVGAFETLEDADEAIKQYQGDAVVTTREWIERHFGEDFVVDEWVRPRTRDEVDWSGQMEEYVTREGIADWPCVFEMTETSGESAETTIFDYVMLIDLSEYEASGFAYWEILGDWAGLYPDKYREHDVVWKDRNEVIHYDYPTEERYFCAWIAPDAVDGCTDYIMQRLRPYLIRGNGDEK